MKPKKHQNLHSNLLRLIDLTWWWGGKFRSPAKTLPKRTTSARRDHHNQHFLSAFVNLSFGVFLQQFPLRRVLTLYAHSADLLTALYPQTASKQIPHTRPFHRKTTNNQQQLRYKESSLGHSSILLSVRLPLSSCSTLARAVAQLALFLRIHLANQLASVDRRSPRGAKCPTGKPCETLLDLSYTKLRTCISETSDRARGTISQGLKLSNEGHGVATWARAIEATLRLFEGLLERTQ